MIFKVHKPMNTMIKVCGMTDADNIRDVEVLGVDMIGFIFYPKSPRYLYQIPRYLPTLAKRVGVFVNETKENILMYVDRFGLNYVQLHGDESPEYCRTLHSQGIRIIKAFPSLCPRIFLPYLIMKVSATTICSIHVPSTTVAPDSNSTGAFCNVTLVVPPSCLAAVSILTVSKL